MEKNEEDKIVFEDYGIEFTDKDFEGVDEDTLIRCKRKLNDLLKKMKDDK